MLKLYDIKEVPEFTVPLIFKTIYRRKWEDPDLMSKL